jgi:hypothetical protein
MSETKSKLTLPVLIKHNTLIQELQRESFGFSYDFLNISKMPNIKIENKLFQIISDIVDSKLSIKDVLLKYYPNIQAHQLIILKEV